MRAAKRVNSFENKSWLLEARTANETYSPPLDDGEVMRHRTIGVDLLRRTETIGSASTAHGFRANEYDQLLSQPDGLVVVNAAVAFLRRHQGPRAEFMCTNSLGEQLGCSEKRVAAARGRLLQMGCIKLTRRAGRGTPALFVWAPKKGRSYD